MIRTGRLSHLLFCSVALVGIAAPAMAQPTTAAKQRQFNFDLPAQSMTEALLAFSRVTGLQVASSPAKLDGLHARKLRGRMPAETALRALTAGTVIDGRIVGDTVVLERQDRADFTQAADAAETGSVAADDQNGGEEIVVTGYRESLSRAALLKRSATGSQDVIVAQDIAAFPDQNLAESLQRVPGVAITRDSGEGRQI